MKTPLEIFSYRRPRSVRRRYQDFIWLHDALTFEFPTCVVPPLPEKHRLNYIKGGRFSREFLERRRLGLQWFLDRVVSHPCLQRSQFTRLFLESIDFVSVKKHEQRFLDMHEYVDKLEDNTKTIVKHYSRVSRNQKKLEKEYRDFAWSIREISTLESVIDQPLRQFAETVESYARYTKEKNNAEDLRFMNDLHELSSYCQSVRDMLHRREKTQIEFEELSLRLQRTVDENHSADKIAEVEFLRKQVVRAGDYTNDFSERMCIEYDIFQTAKKTELRQGMLAYADSHIAFYAQSIKLWESIIPILESIQLEDEE
ncbi:hypothetical protein BX666DRAFT_1852072 [Dichotomocladium elegans]|nr:hypothetical protein BX666DRAFT_1852072 [Dichotomocladium elegans]